MAVATVGICGTFLAQTVRKPAAPQPVKPPAGNAAAAAKIVPDKNAPAKGLSAKPEPPVDYKCHYTEDRFTIDGRADEAAWKVALPVDDFKMPWVRMGSTKPPTATRAKLLWDREHLYFFAELEDTDIYADVKEHDGKTWDNDVLELFLKPADDKPGYYEFQVNAANNTMDMFLPRRNAGGFERFKADGDFEFETAVQVKGTLNQWTDTDTGWSVEGRLAWKDFVRTGGRPEPGERWKFALCRYDFSVDFEGPSLSTSAPLKTNPFPNFHDFEDYAAIEFVGPEKSPRSESAKPFGIEERLKLSTSRVLGSPDPPPGYTVERLFDKLPIKCPIAVARQPGSDRVWIVTQPWSYAPSTLGRFHNDPLAAEVEVLVPADKDQVTYDICFHPQFTDNGYVFVGSNGSFGGAKRSRVTRYHVDPRPPYAFEPESATPIIEWEADGHNGAALAFDSGGLLYVTSGDGTSDSDTKLRGQDLSQLTAKLLRIDVDHPAAGQAYSVPDDNPFVGQPNVRPETWAYGLRNPWRLAIDGVSGQVWIGNNGQDLWEQVYLIERGANYGWSIVEGTHDFYPERERGPQPISKPVADHPHSEARSLTGGLVYRGTKLPELDGAYLYGDYSTGKIWGVRHDGKQATWHKELADTTLQITAFALGNDGDLWLLDHGGGAIYRLKSIPAEAEPPQFPRWLSESGLFKSIETHDMADGVISYSVNAPLWSDGAYKARYLAIPHKAGEDRRIGYTSAGGWTFPDETVLVKSFALETETGKRRWIETRFLVKQQNEWVGYSYQWNAEGNDAMLVDAAGLDREFQVREADVPHGVRTQQWHYPSRTECMTCHSRAANFVLGLQTSQMNRDHDYGGVVDNQLRVLEHLNLLRVNWGGEHYQSRRGEFIDVARKAAEHDLDLAAEEDIERQAGEYMQRYASRMQRDAPPGSSLLARSPDALPRLADPYDTSAPLALRARAYLHSNCAQCHVDAGGGNARINLHVDASRAKMRLFDEKPLHHSFGIADARLVAAGDPDRSVLLRRMETRGAGQMPQLATSVVDRDAIELIREWIRQLPKAR